MLTQFVLALLLGSASFSSVTPRGIEVINVAQREYTPRAVDRAFEEGTPGLSGYLVMKSFTDPSFGGFFVNVESRTSVVIFSPECPGSTSFRWAVLRSRDGIIPRIGYTVLINSTLADDGTMFYSALREAFSREADLIRGMAQPVAVSLCDSTVER